MSATPGIHLLAIACGGAAGAVLRYLVATEVYARLGRDFPYGTLVVNVFGSLLMGVLTVWLLERSVADPVWRGAILVGFLGAFTTFSTFSVETLALIESGEPLRAGLNMLLSVTLCVIAAWIGVVLGRSL